MHATSLSSFMALAFAALTVTSTAQEHEHPAPSAEQLGTVTFETSCNAEFQAPFNRAVALLHSFSFGPAIEAFEAVGRTDPSCGMAFWGIALAAWGNPFEVGKKADARIHRGREAIEHARAAGTRTARERAYIEAVAELSRDVEQRDQRTRVLAYRDAMASITSSHPDDMEASIFYALALAQSAPPTDKSYADLLKAGAILEPLFAAHPDHPGLAHYIIHSYDVPSLAARALDAARRYARIAPSAPHALHMPSHTFTRLGHWQESIDTNIASALAAKREGAGAEELHATDYQVYAYLQSGQDAAAKQLLDSLPEKASRFDPDAIVAAAPGVAGVFALAAIPARWALERGAWTEAAKLEPHPSRFPHTDAMTHFARALGATRVGDSATARAAIEALNANRSRLEAAGESYWAGQVEIQARSATAWLALTEGRTAEALATMREAADQEDGSEKSAITPGPLAPARELLGEMLLQLHEPAAALRQFAATLEKEPGRFRALAGAARAAAESGDRTAATRYYERLLENCEHADQPGRPELVEARRLARAAALFLPPR